MGAHATVLPQRRKPKPGALMYNPLHRLNIDATGGVLTKRVLRMPSANDWLFIIGLACYWPAFRNSFFGLVFAENGGNAQFDVEYLLFLGLVAVVCSACLLRNSIVDRILGSKRIVVFGFGVLASAGISLTYFCGLFDLPWGFSFAGTFLSASGFVVITFAWSLEAARSRERNMFLNIAMSFFLSFILSLTSLLPNPVSLALPFLSWMVSGAAYTAYQPPRTRPDYSQNAQGSVRSALSGLVILLIAFLVIGAIIRGFLYFGTISYSPEQGTYSRRAISLALSLIIVCIAYRADTGRPLLFWLWTLVALVFFCGLFLIGALYPAMPELASGVAISGRTFVSFFLWVALIPAVREKRLSLVSVVGSLFVLVECVSGFCSYFVAPEIARTIDLPIATYLPAFALLIAFILVASTIVFLALLANRKLAELPTANRLSREAACTALAEEHGLTAREAEVMLEFSQGNSLKKVAETMYISTSTAQTHVKSLYRKMGIHSKQELIDLVGECMGER